MNSNYVRISAQFENVEFADATVHRLQKMGAANCRVVRKNNKNEDVIPFNRPTKPEYLMGTQSSYLSGFPHITSGGPIYNGYYEPDESMSAYLSAIIPKEQLTFAQSAIMQNGGFDVSVI